MNYCLLLGDNIALTPMRLYGYDVVLILWPMCCHTGKPCRRHRTGHPIPSQYTYIGPTCRCAIHWCGTLDWKPQLPVIMPWVYNTIEKSFPDLTHAANAILCGAAVVAISKKIGWYFFWIWILSLSKHIRKKCIWQTVTFLIT